MPFPLLCIAGSWTCLLPETSSQLHTPYLAYRALSVVSPVPLFCRLKRPLSPLFSFPCGDDNTSCTECPPGGAAAQKLLVMPKSDLKAREGLSPGSLVTHSNPSTPTSTPLYSPTLG